MMAGLTEAKFAELEETVDSMPPAALQVLKYATFSPFSAIGIPKLAKNRVLNTVNKRQMLKGYRRLAMQVRWAGAEGRRGGQSDPRLAHPTGGTCVGLTLRPATRDPRSWSCTCTRMLRACPVLPSCTNA